MRAIRVVYFLIGAVAICRTGAWAEGADGKKIYETRCVFCHGVEGRGDGPAGAALTPPATNFTAPGYAKKATLDQIKETITQGRQGTAMIAFGKTLKPEEVAAVANYILQQLAGK